MGMKGFGQIALASVVSIFGISAVHAADAAAKIQASEVVTLPSDAAYGGGDKVGSQLIAATYNAGNGPGIWIVADGGYRLYHNANGEYPGGEVSMDDMVYGFCYCCFPIQDDLPEDKDAMPVKVTWRTLAEGTEEDPYPTKLFFSTVTLTR